MIARAYVIHERRVWNGQCIIVAVYYLVLLTKWSSVSGLLTGVCYMYLHFVSVLLHYEPNCGSLITDQTLWLLFESRVELV